MIQRHKLMFYTRKFMSPGQLFRRLITQHTPLPVVGVINSYCALLAQASGHHALYLSGAGVANAAFGLPDLGMTTLTEVVEEARRITDSVSLPLLVDIDTGWGHAFNIARTIKLMERAKVAAVHLEDQEANKRCGHRPNKRITSTVNMLDRIKAAVDARVDEHFVIMARTDALAIEGINQALERAQTYVEAGADMIFAEAITTLKDYELFTHYLKVPVLANITEFGQTPLFSQQALVDVGVKLVLYPLSAFRAMSYAACQVYDAIKKEGTQQSCLPFMQTREALYQVLNYHTYEQTLDKLSEDGHD